VRRHQAPTLIGCELLKIASRRRLTRQTEIPSAPPPSSCLPLAAAEKRDYADSHSHRQQVFNFPQPVACPESPAIAGDPAFRTSLNRASQRGCKQAAQSAKDRNSSHLHHTAQADFEDYKSIDA
jgi:hypothetical protein